jgi:hypothetical protein
MLTPEISDEVIDRVVSDIDRQGFGMIPDFVAPGDLASARRFVSTAIDKTGGEYAWFVGADKVGGSGLEDLGRSPELLRLLGRIDERGTGERAPEQGIYQVLRCLAGDTGRSHSYRFHLDSYVVTMLVPIEIPTHGQTGDLVMLPNTRRLPKSRLWDMAQKALLLNAPVQWGLRQLTTRGVLRLSRVELVPGNAYFFWGARTVHTNEYCDPNQVRATALYHFANPYAASAFFNQPIRRAASTTV